MRIGIRSAISALVLTSIVVSAVGVHLLWWRTAQMVSQTLANTINDQIVSAVDDELQSITTEARSSMTAVRTLLTEKVLDAHDPRKREFVFLSQLQSQPTISWVAFGWPDGAFFAGHKLGESGVEMLTITPDRKLRDDQYDYAGDDIKLRSSKVEDSKYLVTDQPWFRDAIAANNEHWSTLTTLPRGERLAAMLAVPIDVDGKRTGVLAIIIELTRVSNFLSQLTVGKSAGAFLLDRDGGVIASPDPNADEITALKTDHPLLPVAVDAIRQAGPAYNPGDGEVFRSQVTRDGLAYQAVLTPISFPGWSLVTVVPESEFLGPVKMTIRNLLIGLAVLIVGAGLLSAWLAQRLIAQPLIKVVGEIRHVERFDLDKVARYPSHLAEIENLSSAIGDMAQGLAAFRKYIPADLVRRLVSDGNGARLGGAVRPMSVMFIDLAGFTGMSERMGDRIIPLLSRYFDGVSAAIQNDGGTIDKFIGDAVMAFWGAPAADPDHALDCCRAALACQRAVADAGLVDDTGEAVRIRIGINSGDMLVGNIGSEVRLNYTVIGDAVNIASRLESTNKTYGSTIIIGEATRRLAGSRIAVRELDRLAVYGRAGGLQIYELLGLAEEGAASPDWVQSYEAGLAAWRAGDFTAAISAFEKTSALRGGDAASTLMIARCQHQLANPTDAEWDGTAVARSK
ncbi:adenylate/guanylate cyclase domain-containing protein [Bradyrhizobium jicamae]|uniref:Adenylate/guanylate cyclase domain-containing protein n=1 Tax=Bradyrhizobium jicamae TaxID=280332 RepID=A0ABS5FR37_9BRAD|nr:adenylate/guanylate cyclase domain-containing protein [Bradyrhizobium jicamae]MBR0799211.1 adenylate/guanylate cyclase domain-containing protein [Bradyrhizobium jicamae]MBR0938046.1 adenylate/guanylate cyclase domain-containing protein [Bradyrhizobium jicamae]